FEGNLPDLAALSKAKLNQINIHQDKETCLKAPQDQIEQRIWMIGPKRGVSTVAVYVRPQPGEYFVLTPADLKPYQAGGAKSQIPMDQPFCAFLPPLLVTFPSYYDNGQLKPTGQVVKIKNSAPISHNSRWGGTAKNPGANPIIPPGGDVT